MPKFTKLDPKDVHIGRGRAAHEGRQPYRDALTASDAGAYRARSCREGVDREDPTRSGLQGGRRQGPFLVGGQAPARPAMEEGRTLGQPLPTARPRWRAGGNSLRLRAWAGSISCPSPGTPPSGFNPGSVGVPSPGALGRLGRLGGLARRGMRRELRRERGSAPSPSRAFPGLGRGTLPRPFPGFRPARGWEWGVGRLTALIRSDQV